MTDQAASSQTDSDSFEPLTVQYTLRASDFPIPWFLIVGSVCVGLYALLVLLVGVGLVGTTPSPDSATAQPFMVLLAVALVALIGFRLWRWLGPLSRLPRAEATVALDRAGVHYSNSVGSSVTHAWSALTKVVVTSSSVRVLGWNGSLILFVPARALGSRQDVEHFRERLEQGMATR